MTLRSTLTPIGAEKGGNAVGSIPAWQGGIAGLGQPVEDSQMRVNAILSEDPLFSITSGNANQYASHLQHGALAFFDRFPAYRMDVYPSHRTAAAPQRVTIPCSATRPSPVQHRMALHTVLDGAVGGIPFPIPKDGYEVMWNHLLAYWREARETRIETSVVSAAGDVDLTVAYEEIADFSYYYPDVDADGYGDFYFKTQRF